MTDQTQATASKPKRQAVADRQWIDAEGKETNDEMKATGFRYVLLGDGKDKDEQVKNGTAFTYQIDPAKAVALAIFGGLTKAGNIVNTWNHTKAEDRTPAPIDAVSDWFAGYDGGQWGEERAAPGTRFDAAILAKVLAQVTGKPEADFAAKLAKDAPKVKINADGKMDPNGKREVLYGTYALYNTKVKEAYNAAVGSKEPELADL